MSFFKKIGDKTKEFFKKIGEKIKDFFKMIGDENRENPKTAAAIGGGILAVTAVPMALAAAGFGASGVAAGSAAAAWQASIGNVAAGSFFAACQSAGAAGMAASTIAGVGAAGAAIGACMAAAGEKIFGKKKKPGLGDEKPTDLHGVKHHEAGGVAESEQFECFDQNIK